MAKARQEGIKGDKKVGKRENPSFMAGLKSKASPKNPTFGKAGNIKDKGKPKGIG